MPFWSEVEGGVLHEPLIRKRGRYIFPYPVMAVVVDSGAEVTEVRVPLHPPPEHGSLVLQTTVGCPWNRCLFCGSRRGRTFSPRSEEVKDDILLAKEAYGAKPTRIFLADGNSLVLRTDRLVEILALCFDTFPNLERVSTYGSARFLVRKGLDELKLVSRAGLKKVYLGLETGDDDLLKYMEKGATSEDMVKAATMAREADIELSVTVLMGLGGANSWQRNATLTARVLNMMRPPETRLHHLILRRSSPLYEVMMRGEFHEASRHEILKEMRELIGLLEYETKLHTHRLSIRGPPIERKVPEEKEGILKILDFALHHFFGEEVDAERVRGFSMSDILKWDGYEESSLLEYIDEL
jgi:radical SAM superfamily enzyme YgiQ (UPF0313 family)